MKSSAEIILLTIKAVIENYDLDDETKVMVVDCILDEFAKEGANDAV